MSAQQESAGKGKAQAQAKAPASPSVASAPQAQPARQQPAPPFSADDFRRSVNDMSGDLLKAYARRIGIKQGDVDRLSEDRLRQNCKAFLIEQLED